MTLPVNLGKTSVKGSLHLFLGIVISNVTLAASSVVVARLLGAASYGLYALSSLPATFLGLFVGFGVRDAIVKYSAQYNHHKEIEEVKRIVALTLLFAAISSFIFAVFSFFLSSWLANLLSRTDAELLLEMYSMTILTDALVVFSQSIFVGIEKTQYCSILLVFQAILRASISPILVTVGLGPLGAVAGYVAASVSAGVLGVFLVYHSVIKGSGLRFTELHFLSNLRMMISYGIPLYFSNIAVGFRTQFLSFLLAIYASNVLIGNYQVGLNFQVLVNFFGVPITTVLFPAFSKLEFRIEKDALRRTFSSSVKYTSLIIVPATVGLIVLSKEMVTVLYGDTYALAPLYLSLSALSFLYVAFGQYSITAILNGQGETRKNMILGLANSALGLTLALILIPRFQVVGLIISLFVSASPTIILGSWWIRRLYGISLDWSQAIKILVCSFAAGALAFATVSYLNLSVWLGLSTGLVILLSSFIVLAPLMGVISPDDVYNLRTIFSETGIISRLLETPLRAWSMFFKLMKTARARTGTST